MLLEILGHEVRVAFNGAGGTADGGSTGRRTWCCRTSACRSWTATRWRGGCGSEPGFRDVLLVALTGYNGDDDRRRSKEAGFDHHLAKPADVRELQRVLAGRGEAGACGA